MSFWDIVWFIIISFAFIAYLMILFSIIGDLFADRDTSGWIKAVWVIFLIVFPFLSALIYLIANGDHMARRQSEKMRRAREDTDAYIKDVAGAGVTPADQIARAKELLDSGAISQEEFAALKAKALA